MDIKLHSTKDWCHLCGKRSTPLLDIWYSKNAENHPKDSSKYIRICKNCITKELRHACLN